jgi:hypothetical protein
MDDVSVSPNPKQDGCDIEKLWQGLLKMHNPTIRTGLGLGNTSIPTGLGLGYTDIDTGMGWGSIVIQTAITWAISKDGNCTEGRGFY